VITLGVVNKLPRLRNVVAVLVIATILKFWFNIAADNGLNWDDPQSSESSSRLKGIYVCPVQAIPRTFLWNGTSISFQEIWIEHRVHTDHPYVWLWRTTPSGGDYLCFTISPKHLITAPASPFFVCDEGDFGGGVAWVNDGLLFHSWLKAEAFAQHSANLKLVKDWNDPHPASIKLTW
jgi:hypothetical protein